MDDGESLGALFEEHRPRLRAVAYRLLGSAGEADDAVQEAWLRLSRNGTAGVDNLAAWLTTVVSRVSLNMLRARAARREDPLDPGPAHPGPGAGAGAGTGAGTDLVEARAAHADRTAAPDPEEEALLADSVGLALLVVLDTLSPAERLAFVLHDMFAVPFEEIGLLLERSPTAARQLASRARRRVRGAPSTAAAPDLARRRRVVEAFLAASRTGDFEALVGLLDPEVVLHADGEIVPEGKPVVRIGRDAVARGAVLASVRSRFAEPALVDGTVGLVTALGGRLFCVLTFTVTEDRITGIEVVGAPERLRDLEIALLDA
ncbi:sigma-70 family RNA polymerase sigma factor [Streptomonospora sp. S1-112]|uniref:Sigma-70 family RNA polymerase sigma factor n=1 Tax=Streptomonospora mangrovi TaxID=2883123 RepID=A0A9X3NR35_9ACTN|nr:sigma-70 family RNA polymerase sigma factor [Streptomonospora mangrovi]MDA0567812.1 sigma-70 family RNA polymerase sigma factor [Streptomonospora mangrovi]